MLEVSYTGRFKKDYKTCAKRRYDLGLLKGVIASLAVPEKLPEKNKDHDQD